MYVLMDFDVNSVIFQFEKLLNYYLIIFLITFK